MNSIKNIHGREVMDSRGNPTVQVDVVTASGVKGTASAPSGASTGEREAVELRDGDPKRYLGQGVLQAVNHINTSIKDALIGRKVTAQQEIDLDGTDTKAKLGANAILGVSMATAHATANEMQSPLFQYLGGNGPFKMPVPMMNIINGGAHADNNVDFQEFMILPVGASSLREAVRYGAEIFHHLKTVLHKQGLNTAVGDEGGFAPDLKSNEAAIEIILEAIDAAGFTAGDDILLGLDVASSEFYNNSRYCLASENKKLTSIEFAELLSTWVEKYPIITIEDGMDENDWDGWAVLTERIGKNVQLVGDDLFVTNTAILQKGIEKNIANSILIKVNQIGTLSETLAAIDMAKKANYTAVISHRSGETEDTTIADLAVATSAGQIKTGSLSRSDRIAKYDRLMVIEEVLGEKTSYPGREAFYNL